MNCWRVLLVTVALGGAWAPSRVQAGTPAEGALTTLPPGIPLEYFPPPAADSSCSNLGERDPFIAGRCTFQFLAGHYIKTSLGPDGPPFDYTPVAFRLGYMLTSPTLDGCCLRGAFEVLLEGNYCEITRSFGSYITGPNAICRFNFVQEDSVVVPYIQLGAGLAFTDAWKTPRDIQALIGQEQEFLLRGEIGARVMMTECLSLDAEFGIQHISNAGLAPTNGGINNLGLTLGFTYFFGKSN